MCLFVDWLGSVGEAATDGMSQSLTIETYLTQIEALHQVRAARLRRIESYQKGLQREQELLIEEARRTTELFQKMEVALKETVPPLVISL